MVPWVLGVLRQDGEIPMASSGCSHVGRWVGVGFNAAGPPCRCCLRSSLAVRLGRNDGKAQGRQVHKRQQLVIQSAGQVKGGHELAAEDRWKYTGLRSVIMRSVIGLRSCAIAMTPDTPAPSISITPPVSHTQRSLLQPRRVSLSLSTGRTPRLASPDMLQDSESGSGTLETAASSS